MSENLLLIIVLWPFIAAFLSAIVGLYRDEFRNYFVIFATAIEFLMVMSLWMDASNTQPLNYYWDGLFGVPLHLSLDGFRYIYSLITTFMWSMTALFSYEYFSSHNDNLNRYYLFYLMTLGATMGVMLSGNLWTTFVFFEIMSLTSYVLVLHDETSKAINAANIFLAVGVIGGLFMLIGLFMLQAYLGTTEISALVPAVSAYQGPRWIIYTIGALLTIGFGGKAGMFPLHFWLPMAHPVAPAPASALLSGILTKAGIFGLLVVGGNLLLHDSNWGLVYFTLGAITMFLGAFRALFSVDLKQTLALSSVSQIGFIIVAIGMQGILQDHNALAVRGSILHMVNHSLIKLVLFMAAGAIYMKVHQLDLNTLQGYGRNKPVLKVIFAIGSLSLMSIPLFSGYISKTLIHESIVEYIWLFTGYSSVSFFFQLVESLFTLSGGFTVAYMLKIFIAIFVEENPYLQDDYEAYNENYLSPLSMLALGLPAAILLILGVFPALMNSLAGFAQPFVHGQAPGHKVHYFAWANLKGALASISIGLITYYALIRNLLMVEDENGHNRYVHRNLGFIMTFMADVGKRAIRGIYSGIEWLVNFISVLPSFFANEILNFHRQKAIHFFQPIEDLGGISYAEKDTRNVEKPSIDKIITSSLGFSLLEVTLTLIIIIVVIFALQ